MFPTLSQRGGNVSWLLCVVLIVGNANLRAQAPATPAVDTKPSATNTSDEITAQAEREQGRKRAYAGLMAIVGIAIAGVGLLATTILWGGRLRRENRKPLPPAELKDELWFLRAKSGRTAPNANTDANTDPEPTEGE